MGKHLILVADTSTARIMEKNGSGLRLLDPVYTRDKELDDFDLGASKPGRVKGPAGNQTYYPKSDIHRTEKEHFIREVARHLNQDFDKIESLVLVAPPQMLGELRKLLSHNVVSKVAHEVAKDLTKLREDELASYVTKPYT